ncbi:MAG: PAS domain S-box protein [Nitrospirales bacterium]|nr:PAS domain S-box protein [Nitrospirales bacterium]
MTDSPLSSNLERELHTLRQELANLRAIQTMHQETQAGLEVLEQQLAGIIHSAMDGIITIDENHRVVLFNTAAEQIFRCSAEEAVGKPLDQFLPPSLRHIHRAHIDQFAESEERNRRMDPYREIQGVRLTGEEFPLEASISQVERSGKKWFTVILRDITQRKVQENRISQLGRILDESINEVYVFDGESLFFTLANRAARDNTGFSMEELAGMTPLDLKSEFTPEAFEELVQPLKQGTRRKIDFQTTHRRKNRTTYPVEVHVQYLTQEGKGFFVAIILDLTERIKTQQQLQETQRTLSTLLTNLPGMVYRCRNDEGWTMEFLSPGCQGLTGYSSDAFLGANSLSYARDVILPEEYGRVHQEMQDALKSQRPFQLSYRIRTAHGTLKWVWEQGCGIYSEGGTVLAIEGYIIDITQERMLEDQLRKTERLAELGTLASGMAHEIGTPMNVILGRAELLMRKAKDEHTRSGLATIVTQVERITKIMNQLLSFARRRPSERRAVDLRTVVTDVLDVLREKLRKQGIQVQRMEAPSIPRACADPDQMNQVLLNLVLNACQAMPEGGTLTLGLRPVGEGVELKVQDTGCGMSDEDAKKVFDPFFTTKPVGEGTGLGLTVVHGIVQEHEGTIRIGSAPGQGATFIVTLPIHHPHALSVP